MEEDENQEAANTVRKATEKPAEDASVYFSDPELARQYREAMEKLEKSRQPEDTGYRD